MGLCGKLQNFHRALLSYKDCVVIKINKEQTSCIRWSFVLMVPGCYLENKSFQPFC